MGDYNLFAYDQVCKKKWTIIDVNGFFKSIQDDLKKIRNSNGFSDFDKINRTKKYDINKFFTHKKYDINEREPEYSDDDVKSFLEFLIMYCNRIYSTEKHEKYVTTLYEKPPTISTYSMYFSPLAEKQEWTHEAVNKFINFFIMYMKNDVTLSERKYVQYLSKNNEVPNIISYYTAFPNKHNQSSNTYFSYLDILHYTSFCYMRSKNLIIAGSLEDIYQATTDVDFYSHHHFFSSKKHQVKIKSSDTFSKIQVSNSNSRLTSPQTSISN